MRCHYREETYQLHAFLIGEARPPAHLDELDDDIVDREIAHMENRKRGRAGKRSTRARALLSVIERDLVGNTDWGLEKTVGICVSLLDAWIGFFYSTLNWCGNAVKNARDELLIYIYIYFKNRNIFWLQAKRKISKRYKNRLQWGMSGLVGKYGIVKKRCMQKL